MAVISGYGAQEEQGGTAFASYVDTGDYQLEVFGASWSWRNRLELSVAQQKLTHDSLTAALGLPTDSISQRIFSAKLRVMGDLIYTPMPQISLGMQHKKKSGLFGAGSCRCKTRFGYGSQCNGDQSFSGGIL